MPTKLLPKGSLSGAISRAHWYDRTTRRDMAGVKRLAMRISGMVRPGSQVLEIGPGPGYLAIELARRGLETSAVETRGMWVEMARRNAERAGVRVDVCFGDPAELPVASESVDFVVCRAAFKSFAEPVKTMQEMRRVLKPGGTALLSDLRRDAPAGEIEEYVKAVDDRRLHRWFMMRVFQNVLNKRAYVVEEVRRMADEAGWRNAVVRPCPLGFEAWVRK